MKMGFWRILRS